jgi:hypothetical protein
MKNVLHSIFVVTIAASLVASASVPSEAARRAARVRSFDGVWSVVIYTLYGNCPQALPPIQSTSLRFSLRQAGRRRASRSSIWTSTSPPAAGWRRPWFSQPKSAP